MKELRRGIGASNDRTEQESEAPLGLFWASFGPVLGLPLQAALVQPPPVLPDTDAVLTGSERQTAIIRTWLPANASANDTAALLGGNRAARLAKIRAAKAGVMASASSDERC
jgi:hypothetical protein